MCQIEISLLELSISLKQVGLLPKISRPKISTVQNIDVQNIDVQNIETVLITLNEWKWSDLRSGIIDTVIKYEMSQLKRCFSVG